MGALARHAALPLSLLATFVVADWISVNLRGVPPAPSGTAAGGAAAVVVVVFFLAAALVMGFAFWALRTGRRQLVEALILVAISSVLLVIWIGPIGRWGDAWNQDVAWAAAFVVTALVALAVWWSRLARAQSALAILLAAAIAAVTALALGWWPVVALSVAAAGLDAWAVRRGTMTRLAHGVQHLPLFVHVGAGPPSTGPERGPKLLIGLGDLLFPAMIVMATGYVHEGAGYLAILGALAGAVVLGLRLHRRPIQAGLPWLNGGALAGGAVGLLIG